MKQLRMSKPNILFNPSKFYLNFPSDFTKFLMKKNKHYLNILKRFEKRTVHCNLAFTEL